MVKRGVVRSVGEWFWKSGRGALLAAPVLVAGCGGDDIGTQDDNYLREVAPCAEGSCWETSADLRPCGFTILEENFATGLYNAHRYATSLDVPGTIRVVASSLSGEWTPAVVITDADGRVLFDGRDGAAAGDVYAEGVARQGEMPPAEVILESDQARDLHVFVTSEGALGSGFADGVGTDASYRLVMESLCEQVVVEDAIAPQGILPDEIPADAGAIPIGLTSDWGPALRFDVPARTHMALRLGASSGAEMQILQWTGQEVQEIAITNGAGHTPVMAVLDEEADRTYWVRSRGAPSMAAVVAAPAPFRPDLDCEDDCDRLMQLPLPNDPTREGYDMVENVVYRRQFGRRDVIMAVRHAGRVVARQGIDAFTIEDLSNPDGSRPPGHASHTGGKDVDFSVYNADGEAVWYPLCQETNDNCISGTSFGMDAEAMAFKISGIIENGRVTNIFLDREFHDVLFAAADALADIGQLPPSHPNEMRAVVSHWPNHNNHIHVRYETW